MTRSFKWTPGTVTIFAAAFLATDYFFYKQEFKYVNSLVWVHLLGGRGGAAGQSSQRQ